MRDVRYAFRVLLRTPGFTAIAVIALALGIGANTAIFSVVSGVLLRPLPFPDPEQLVQINETFLPHGLGTASAPNLADWRAQSTSFDAMVGYSYVNKNLQAEGEPERVAGVAADRAMFRMAGIAPLAGRTFRDDDPPNVVVISEGFWKRQFSGAGAAVGGKIKLDGEPYTVIGVMPEKFQFPYGGPVTELWIPLVISPQQAQTRGNHYLFVAGRLKSGVSPASAQSEMAAIAKRIESQYADTQGGRSVLLTPLADAVTGSVRTSLMILLGAVGLVLLIACANVANLLLARAAVRTREVAIRAALGASRARLIRQFLIESVILAIAGGAAGILLANWGTSLLLALAEGQIPRAQEIGLDWRVFVFLLGVSVVTGIVFGLAPAFAASRVDVQNNLKDGGRGSGGRSQGRLRDGLVVAEIALAFVLLMGAGLLLRAFWFLQSTDTGIATEQVLTVRMTTSASRYADAGALDRYYRSIEDRVRAIPGVRASGFINLLPLHLWGRNGNVSIEGRAPDAPGREPFAELRVVTPGYFHAMGIGMKRGRELSDADTSQSQPVAVINETLATKYFGGEDPIGRKTNRGVIVGVVADVRQISLDQPPAAEVYQPASQVAQYTMTLAVAGQTSPEALTSAVRGAIRQADPAQALYSVRTMRRVLADSLSDRTLYMRLLAAFAALALALAIAGIYGVISYAVTARTQEFGIRLALGADGRGVLGLVMKHGAILVAIGLALGVAGSFVLTRLIKSLLSGVTPTDPLTMVTVSAILAAVALAACAVPARRAMKVDPLIALRYE